MPVVDPCPLDVGSHWSRCASQCTRVYSRVSAPRRDRPGDGHVRLLLARENAGRAAALAGELESVFTPARVCNVTAVTTTRTLAVLHLATVTSGSGTGTGRRCTSSRQVLYSVLRCQCSVRRCRPGMLTHRPKHASTSWRHPGTAATLEGNPQAAFKFLSGTSTPPSQR